MKMPPYSQSKATTTTTTKRRKGRAQRQEERSLGGSEPAFLIDLATYKTVKIQIWPHSTSTCESSPLRFFLWCGLLLYLRRLHAHPTQHWYL